MMSVQVRQQIQVLPTLCGHAQRPLATMKFEFRGKWLFLR